MPATALPRKARSAPSPGARAKRACGRVARGRPYLRVPL